MYDKDEQSFPKKITKEKKKKKKGRELVRIPKIPAKDLAEMPNKLLG